MPSVRVVVKEEVLGYANQVELRLLAGMDSIPFSRQLLALLLAPLKTRFLKKRKTKQKTRGVWSSSQEVDGNRLAGQRTRVSDSGLAG